MPETEWYFKLFSRRILDHTLYYRLPVPAHLTIINFPDRFVTDPDGYLGMCLAPPLNLDDFVWNALIVYDGPFRLPLPWVWIFVAHIAVGFISICLHRSVPLRGESILACSIISSWIGVATPAVLAVLKTIFYACNSVTCFVTPNMTVGYFSLPGTHIGFAVQCAVVLILHVLLVAAILRMVSITLLSACFTTHSKPLSCPRCRYPAVEGSAVCPECGFDREKTSPWVLLRPKLWQVGLFVVLVPVWFFAPLWCSWFIPGLARF